MSNNQASQAANNAASTQNATNPIGPNPSNAGSNTNTEPGGSSIGVVNTPAIPREPEPSKQLPTSSKNILPKKTEPGRFDWALLQTLLYVLTVLEAPTLD
ncbi:hypothetical protein FRC14_000446 [Serendipita sp. 396]|nr:hypothetical protein FRC14_000446 [Serendipita sp. 396]KAG8808903.1 hypothetical protein FRC18_004814 [Serendipita sp. 400]